MQQGLRDGGGQAGVGFIYVYVSHAYSHTYVEALTYILIYKFELSSRMHMPFWVKPTVRLWAKTKTKSFAQTIAKRCQIQNLAKTAASVGKLDLGDF